MRISKAAIEALRKGATCPPAPSERIFSQQAALIIREKRNRLGPEISGKMLYLKENWDQVLQLNLRDAVIEEEEDEIEIY